MSRQNSSLLLGAIFSLICGVAHFSFAKDAPLDDGALTITRSSKAGAIGQPISIELVHAQNTGNMIHRKLSNLNELSIPLAPGWYHVTCRSAEGNGVQGHSISISAGKESRLRCHFTTQKAPTGIAKNKPKGTHKIAKTGLSNTTAGSLDAELSAGPIMGKGSAGRGAGAGRIGRRGPTIHRRLQRRGRVRLPAGVPNYNREAYGHTEENIFRDPKASPLSTFSIDVDSASYANSRRFLEQMNQLPPAGAVRVEEFINYFNYDYPKPEDGEPFGIHSEVSACPWNSDSRLIHIGVQAPEIPFAKAAPMNLVFLIDVSGSMGAPNKLPLLKNAFSLLVNRLREQDKVSIVVYASREGLALPSTSGSKKGVILRALEGLRSGGSTAGSAGIKLAYSEARKHFIEGGNNRVILATDGDFNVGVSSHAGLVRLVKNERDSGVFLSVLGFGRGNYQDSRMEELSNHGNGFAAYIDTMREAKKVFVNQLTGTLITVAKDVKVQVEFNPAKVESYRLIGYANRKLAAEDFRNDKKDAGDMGSGHSVTALYEIVPVKAGATRGKVAPLRYQSQSSAIGHDGELMSLRVRYKTPEGATSKLIEKVLVDHNAEIGSTSNAFRFSAAVAQFAMLLNHSKHKGTASFAKVLELGRPAVGNDPKGERAEFIRLAEKAKSISGQQTRVDQ